MNFLQYIFGRETEDTNNFRNDEKEYRKAMKQKIKEDKAYYKTIPSQHKPQVSEDTIVHQECYRKPQPSGGIYNGTIIPYYHTMALDSDHVATNYNNICVTAMYPHGIEIDNQGINNSKL